MADEEPRIDDYRLLNCIATGSTCQVWEAVGEDTPEHVAMKLLLPEALSARAEVQALRHEARVAKSLSHPGFVEFHRIVIGRKHGYMIMQYFRAPNLKTILHQDPYPVQVRFKKLVEALSLALEHMHSKGWVHKDIKPDNILMAKSGDTRLIDFSLTAPHVTGLAKWLSGKPKAIQGTRTYIAPEVIKKEHVTPQTDIYCLGVSLFEVLAGQPPFTGTSPNDLLRKHLSANVPPVSSFNPNVTPEMDDFLRRCMAKKPAHRYSSMADLYAEFRTLRPFKEELPPARTAINKEEITQQGGPDSRADAQRQARRGPDESSVRSQTQQSTSKSPVAKPPAPAQRPKRPSPQQSNQPQPPSRSAEPQRRADPPKSKDGDLPLMDELPDIL